MSDTEWEQEDPELRCDTCDVGLYEVGSDDWCYGCGTCREHCRQKHPESTEDPWVDPRLKTPPKTITEADKLLEELGP